jgi:integrase
MVFVAVHTGLRVSELIGLRWRNVHADSITVEQRCCRGDRGAPKSEASNATIAVNRQVIVRIERLKTLTVEVKAGRGLRKYPAVHSFGPDDLVFQSVKDGRPMRDNNILSRHIKPAGRLLGMPWLNWLVPAYLTRHMAEDGRRRCEGCTGADAAQPGQYDSGRLPEVRP